MPPSTTSASTSMPSCPTENGISPTADVPESSDASTALAEAREAAARAARAERRYFRASFLLRSDPDRAVVSG